MKWVSLFVAGFATCVGGMAQTSGTALTRRAPEIAGTVDGSVHQMLGAAVTLTGSAAITGDLLVPGTPEVRVVGSPTYGGLAPGGGALLPTNYEVTIGGNARLRFLRSRSDPMALPMVSQPMPPAGTRSVTLSGTNRAVGDFATLKDLTLLGGSGLITVPEGAYGAFMANASGSGFALGNSGATQPALYHFQRLALSANTELRVLGPVIVTVGEGVTLGGIAGSPETGARLQLRIWSGGLTLQGHAEFYGAVQAPSGTLQLGGSSRMTGSVAADRITVSGGALLRVVTFNRPPVVALTAPASGATFTASSSIVIAADASDPEGTLRTVEFYAGGVKIGEDDTAPYSITWAGVPAGSYSLQAVAIDSAGASTVSAPVPITVTRGQPPSVSLTAPTAGASFVSSVPITLSAMANDPDGTVVRVEFYHGAVKIGEALSAPFTASWLAAPGTYSITARAHDNVGLSADSEPVVITVRAGLPYFTDFEATEGYLPGSLAGQQAWEVPQGAASIITSVAYSGASSVSLATAAPPAQIAHSFVSLPGQSVVFVDFFAKPVADADVNLATLLESESARFALLRNGASGTVYVFDGTGQRSGTWRSTGVAKPLAPDGAAANWLRFTLRQDYPAKRWDLSADGVLIAANLGFRDNALTAFATFGIRGHTAAVTGFDYFFAGTDNPLFADADRDGIDDAYETANGMNIQSNDRAGDIDGDGLSNLEEFMFGTRANVADTDGDGMPDGWEVKYGLNPRLNDGASDLDGDGVSNAAEYAQGRNPTKGAIPDTAGVVGLMVFQPL